jgi:hypothetical protein
MNKILIILSNSNKYFYNRILLKSIIFILLLTPNIVNAQKIIPNEKAHFQINKKSLKNTGESPGTLENIVISENPITGTYLSLVYVVTETGIKKVDVDIYNLLGKIIQSNVGRDFVKGTPQEYNVSSLSEGLYILKLKDMDKNEIAYRKILIMK